MFFLVNTYKSSSAAPPAQHCNITYKSEQDFLAQLWCMVMSLSSSLNLNTLWIFVCVSVEYINIYTFVCVCESKVCFLGTKQTNTFLLSILAAEKYIFYNERMLLVSAMNGKKFFCETTNKSGTCFCMNNF